MMYHIFTVKILKARNTHNDCIVSHFDFYCYDCTDQSRKYNQGIVMQCWLIFFFFFNESLEETDVSISGDKLQINCCKLITANSKLQKEICTVKEKYYLSHSNFTFKM